MELKNTSNSVFSFVIIVNGILNLILNIEVYWKRVVAPGRQFFVWCKFYKITEKHGIFLRKRRKDKKGPLKWAWTKVFIIQINEAIIKIRRVARNVEKIESIKLMPLPGESKCIVTH